MNSWSDESYLNTANSINIGRLLPQLTYYAYTSWQHWLRNNQKASYIIPTGNTGNITAAFWAKEMGFPIDKISMSLNANDTIRHFVNTGEYLPQESIETIANAMDVGKPSNFERLLHLFNHDHKLFCSNIESLCVSDDNIRSTINEVYNFYGEVICPAYCDCILCKKLPF